MREQFDVNTFSHLEFVQNLVEPLSNGKIINVSSMASFGHFPFISPYCASKRAMDIFFNAFAIENHHNIKVVSVKPGVIATPIWQKSVNSNEKLLNNCEGYEKEMEFMKRTLLKIQQRELLLIRLLILLRKLLVKITRNLLILLVQMQDLQSFYHYFRRMSLILLLSLA